MKKNIKIFGLVLFLFFAVCHGIEINHMNSISVDISKIDNNPHLNKYESDFLNEYLKDLRNTFDFYQKRIIFVTGSSGSTIGNKKQYFKSLNNWNNKHKTNDCRFTSIIIFNSKEKEISGGYDAILTYCNKLKPNKENIIKQIRAN